jgi:hypothetical protein
MKPDIEQILAAPTASVPDAGAVLGLSRYASYSAAHRGEIPTLKFGNRLRVPTARLRQMITDGVQPSVPADPDG